MKCLMLQDLVMINIHVIDCGDGLSDIAIICALNQKDDENDDLLVERESARVNRSFKRNVNNTGC